MAKRENPFRPQRPLAPPRAGGARHELDQHEVETEERWIEATIAWGEGAVLHVAHIRPGESFTLGEEPAEGTFVVGREALGLPRLVLVEYDGERALVAIAPDATVERGAASGSDVLAPIASHLRSVHLAPNETIRIRHGALSFTVREVRAGRRVRKTGPLDWAFLGQLLAVAFVFSALAILSSLAPPRAGALGAPALDPTNRYVQHAIRMAERDEPEAPRPRRAPTRDQEGTTADAPSPRRTTERLVRRPHGSASTEPSREALRARAGASTVAEAFREIAAGLPAGSPFELLGEGAPPPAWGGESSGFGGLDMRDVPRAHVGVEGTIAANLDRISGGAPRAPEGGTRRAGRIPTPTVSVEVGEGGGLEREVVRRVVRRNEAQVRFCYERSLQGNPELAGRVEIRFLIAPDGAVRGAAILRSEVGREVGECIASAVRRMSFPAPEGGLVAVNYAWTFQAP